MRPVPDEELAELRTRVAEAEGILRAIRTGEVDAVVTGGKGGIQVFTLEGAEHAYRLLIESMNEGALTLTADKTILYANQCFARMVKCPLEQVQGSSLRRFLSPEDRAKLRPLMKRAAKSGSKIHVQLHASDGSLIPALLSIKELAHAGSQAAIIGMVVTDMTEVHRTEELLRTLTHRVVQAQEAERRLVALELHDNITQHLCAILARWQVVAKQRLVPSRAARGEMLQLSAMLGQTIEEVQRIAHHLRPSVLDYLGLVPALRTTCTEFADRTGVPLKLACVELITRLPAEAELSLYRILQNALENVEQHARARHVTVDLTKPGRLVQLRIKDDGIGFDPSQPTGQREEECDFGLLRMRERATYVGGVLLVKSARGAGTEIVVSISLPPVNRVVN